jgi:hypothetical protein
MAKQTFTTGQVLTAAQMTSLQQTAMLGGAANAKIASYVLVAADAGDAITMSNAGATTITVDTGLFAAGDIVTIINIGAGACTITAGTATVTTSGSLVLAQNQGGVLRFTSASAAIFLQFATPASGDIEGVTAGTGISGGGTSGTVTITNSMATEIDAKGDLVVGTGADTFARLAVGTDGHTLVADSAQATGLKWAAPAGALTKISTTTFSAVATQDIDNIFTSTYNTYLVVIDRLGASDGGYDLQLQMRYGSSTETSAGYYGATVDATPGGSQSVTGTNNGTLFTISPNAGPVGMGSGQIYFTFSQNGGGSTGIVAISGQYVNFQASAGNYLGGQTPSRVDAYTGLRFMPSAGTISGTITVFGVQK